MNFHHTCHSLYIKSNWYALLCVTHLDKNNSVESFSVTVFVQWLLYDYHRHHHYLLFIAIWLTLRFLQVIVLFIIVQSNTVLLTPLSTQIIFSPSLRSVPVCITIKSQQPYSLFWLACKLNTKFGRNHFFVFIIINIVVAIVVVRLSSALSIIDNFCNNFNCRSSVPNSSGVGILSTCTSTSPSSWTIRNNYIQWIVLTIECCLLTTFTFECCVINFICIQNS